MLQRELTVNIDQIIPWTDSTTVLNWLQSDSGLLKVFVGTRVARVQELTNTRNWRFVDSLNSSADDITMGKTLLERFTDLVKATAEYLHKAIISDSQSPTAETF